MTVLATAPHPVLELALGLLEGSVGASPCGQAGGFVRRCAAHENLAPWETQVDGDAVAIAVAMMVARQINHDVARDDAVEKPLELLGTTPDVGR
jgi:hypothetical protein